MENLNEINCSMAFRFSYVPSAAEECAIILKWFGFNYVHVKGAKGSHSAEIYVPEEYREEFDKQILHKTLIGKYRKFFIGEGVHFGVHYYYVNYLKKYDR